MSPAEGGGGWGGWGGIARDKSLVGGGGEGREARPPRAGGPLYATPARGPCAGDSQHHVALDFDPGPEGRAGQVINCGRDDEVLHAIAGTFAGFLTFVARQFVLERVCLGKDEDPDDPRWLAVDGGKRDLLTG